MPYSMKLNRKKHTVNPETVDGGVWMGERGWGRVDGGRRMEEG